MDELTYYEVRRATEKYKDIPEYNKLLNQFFKKNDILVPDEPLDLTPEEIRFKLYKQKLKEILEELQKINLPFSLSDDYERRIKAFFVEYKYDFLMMKQLLDGCYSRYEQKIYHDNALVVKDIYVQADIAFEKGIINESDLQSFKEFVRKQFS